MRHLLLSLLFIALSFTSLAAEDLGTAVYDSSESTITIFSMVRKNNVVTVKGKYDCNGEIGDYDVADAHQTGFLFDEEKGVKYFPLKDTNNKILASSPARLRKKGESSRFWVKFPAPPEEVTTISVYFTKYEPLDDLPITDK